MPEIQRGDYVLARTAHNDWVRRRALTGQVKGMDFPVVWVCRDEDWEGASAKDGADPDAGAVPWPANAVKPDA